MNQRHAARQRSRHASCFLLRSVVAPSSGVRSGRAAVCAVGASGAWRLEQLYTYALSLPHTTVVKQWGECLVFKVAGKMFLIIALNAQTVDGVVFKCTPDEFDGLTDIDGITQAPYCAKRHWVRMADLAALSPGELEQRIRRSYDLVVEKLTKKLRAQLEL